MVGDSKNLLAAGERGRQALRRVSSVGFICTHSYGDHTHENNDLRRTGRGVRFGILREYL